MKDIQFRVDVFIRQFVRLNMPLFLLTIITANNIPQWKVSGDWFDVCKCNIPCPCTYAQTPSYGDCDGVLAYHIKKGQYDQTPLNGLNVLVLSYFKGNIWAGETKASLGIFFDEKANPQQRDALQMIFSESWRIYG